MFGPKNTARDVTVALIAGLTDGSITLRHPDTQAVAKPVSPLNDLFRNGTELQTSTEQPIRAKLSTKERR